MPLEAEWREYNRRNGISTIQKYNQNTIIYLSE